MNKMKVEVVVPDWVNWIAVDKSGEGIGYSEEPKKEVKKGEWWPKTLSTEWTLLYVGKPPKNWRAELYTYK